MKNSNKEDWNGQFPQWYRADDRQLVRLYYGDVPVEEIGKTLNRDSLQIVLRLLELRILDNDEISLVWDDRLKSRKAA